MKLNEIRDNNGAHYVAKRGRPRHRLRQGQDQRPRRQGPDRAHRRCHQRLRRRPDAAASPLAEARLQQHRFQQRLSSSINTRPACRRRSMPASSRPVRPVNGAALVEAGMLRRARDGVRLLAKGELKAGADHRSRGASKAAVDAVEKRRRDKVIVRGAASPDAGCLTGAGRGLAVRPRGSAQMASAAEQLAATSISRAFAKATELKKADLVHARRADHLSPRHLYPAARYRSGRCCSEIFARRMPAAFSACSTCSRAARSARMTIFALNIMPYISASIIVQLLTAVIAAARGAEEGRRGRAQEAQPIYPLWHGLPRRGPGLWHCGRSRRHARGNRSRRSSIPGSSSASRP